MKEHITINEVGLRDGLQNQPRILSTEAKLQVFEALAAAGLKDFEVTSFVAPEAVPQLADAVEVMAALPRDSKFKYTCLVPNFRGYERAVSAGATGIAVILAATDTMNRKNINMSLEQALLVCGDVVRRAKSDGLFVRVYLAAAFECAFEGPTPPKVVFDLLEKMAVTGPDEFAIADTIGAANPRQVRHIFEALVKTYGTTRISAHFHDTRGLASALALTALEFGIRRFDSSVAGLGGCPFVPGASGNAATEDLVFLFHELGFDTGVDFDKLIETVDTVKGILPEAPGGRILGWCRGRSARNASSKADIGLGLSR